MIRHSAFIRICMLGALLGVTSLSAQVYSPKVLSDGQPDASDLKAFTRSIYSQAHASTDREKAEAIWRFFLTDGRFVKPGFWYHIAGWAYEEPTGEVLDPVKLLNSYGFGLCYHIAPLLEAIFEAGGFADARCWFLTGHTVAEVFYDGAYHYFDSDMMGYNFAGTGSFRGKPVSSVHDLETDPQIILGKLAAPKLVKPGTVDNPWYPADVQAEAMGGLEDLFRTAADNRLYPYTRYSEGHKMDFVLRRGESLTRFFHPEQPGLFYLPYAWDGKSWHEFPQESTEYQIWTKDGPHSQKDKRLWATGRIEYAAPPFSGLSNVIDMPSPYVIIDAAFHTRTDLAAGDSLRAETSVDGGAHWDLAAELAGPFQGDWAFAPRELAKSEHGHLTAVSGRYGYQLRITRSSLRAGVSGLHLTSRIQLNPRSLPAVVEGANRFTFSAGQSSERVAMPAALDYVPKHALQLETEDGQQFLYPAAGGEGYILYKVESSAGPLTGFDIGARFLDVPDSIVPSKLTAETRRSQVSTRNGTASISWALTPHGPFRELWKYPQNIPWRDGRSIERLLRWPDVFREVHSLPPGTTSVYVKISTTGPAVDNLRLARYQRVAPPAGAVEVMQLWRENGLPREHSESFAAADGKHNFAFRASAGVENESITIRCR